MFKLYWGKNIRGLKYNIFLSGALRWQRVGWVQGGNGFSIYNFFKEILIKFTKYRKMIFNNIVEKAKKNLQNTKNYFHLSRIRNCNLLKRDITN